MSFKVQTESGSVYDVEFVEKGLKVSKDGGPAQMAIAIHPKLLPNVKATVRVEQQGPYHCGFNEQGNRTLRVIPDQIRTGMILANRRGFKTTRIVKVV
jgi:hypothetical protein